MKTFAPPEARRILRKLEFHYTPTHGSWLNLAELELSVRARQAINQRIPSRTRLSEIVDSYEARRNAAQATINWQFTPEKARLKLHRLYPSTPL